MTELSRLVEVNGEIIVYRSRPSGLGPPHCLHAQHCGCSVSRRAQKLSEESGFLPILHQSRISIPSFGKQPACSLVLWLDMGRCRTGSRRWC